MVEVYNPGCINSLQLVGWGGFFRLLVLITPIRSIPVFVITVHTINNPLQEQNSTEHYFTLIPTIATFRYPQANEEQNAPPQTHRDSHKLRRRGRVRRQPAPPAG